MGGRAHLEVAHHHQARSVGAACDERRGVDPGMTALLQELPVAQEADQGHWGRRAQVGPALALAQSSEPTSFPQIL